MKSVEGAEVLCVCILVADTFLAPIHRLLKASSLIEVHGQHGAAGGCAADTATVLGF